MENNKFIKRSQIFTYTSLGLAVLSIPFYFLGLFADVIKNEFISLIDIFEIELAVKDGDLFVPIILVVAIVFTVIAAVLGIFKTKATKLISIILMIIPLALDVVAVCKLCSEIVKIGYGSIVVLICIAISLVLSILSTVFFFKGTAASDEIDMTFVYQQENIIGAGDDTVILNNTSAVQQDFSTTDYQPSISFLSGCCEGFNIPITQKSIIIGKDPSQCSVIISKNYTNISRKHCEISFDYAAGQYIITDYSANGTFTESGVRFNQGQPMYMPCGSLLTLAKTDNILRLN